MATKHVKLDLVAWTWNPDFVHESLDLFSRTVGSRHDLEISSAVTHYDWRNYPEKVGEHLAADKPIDVLYASDDWLSDWAVSGHIAPVEDHRPKIRSYATDFADFNTQGMTYKGKLYGLPYYCDRFGFVCNEALLREAGIIAPPRTWAELVDQCKIITAKTGIKHPLTLPFGFGHDVIYPVSVEAFYSLVYSRPNGWCFTPELKPLFGRGSVADDTLRWCLRAQEEFGILDPACSNEALEGVIGALQSGKNVFTIVPTYCLKEMNSPKHGKWGGRFKLALMPETGYTVGYTRFYAIATQALERGGTQFEAAWRLLEFLGGKSDPEDTGRQDYYTMRRWILKDGLGFAQTALFADAAVRHALSDWIDVNILQEQADKAKHKRGMEAPWWRQWYVISSQTIKAAMRQEISCETAMDILGSKWLALETDWKAVMPR